MSSSFRIVATRWGNIGIVAGPRGLRRTYLPGQTQASLRRCIWNDFADAVEDRALLPKLAAALRDYFDGRRVRFDVRLDCDTAGDFTRAVWNACRRVGHGRTVTYGELARKAGRPGAARAVGTAMARNPFSIVVPCHRVLRSDGSLGGYSGPGGVDFKQQLLEMESAI